MTSERPGFLAKVIAASIRNRVLILLFGLLLAGAGIWSLFTTPVDAIPDLSDAQVIVYTEYKGQSPRTLEDQVTYPLTTALVSVPGAKTVRGYSFFGYSLVYILFEDGIDPYWARSRVAVSPSRNPIAPMTGIGQSGRASASRMAKADMAKPISNKRPPIIRAMY